MVFARALLLCENAHEDSVSGHATLVAIFASVQATSFPSPSRHFYAWAWVVGDPTDSGDIGLTCHEEGGNWFLPIDQALISFAQRPEQFVRFHVELRFPRPGRYRFELTFDDRTIATQTIILQEVF